MVSSRTLSISGAAISRADTNCELAVASTAVRPPARRRPRTCTPSASASTSAPSARSVSISAAMGRDSRRGEPVMVTSVPSVAASRAVPKRSAAPLSAASTVPVRAVATRRMASVSAQSARGPSYAAPAAAMATARTLMLLLGGSVSAVSSISSGGSMRSFMALYVLRRRGCGRGRR